MKVKAITSRGFWEQQPWKEIGINGEAEVADEAGYQVVKLWGRPGWREHSMTGGSGQEGGIGGTAMMAEGGPEPAEDPDGQRGSTAITFAPGSNIAPGVQSSLKRLHQNLGHPSVDDLARHLRFAGAGPEVIGAAKRLTCQVCLRCKRGGTRKPASPPTLLSFNQVVGVDIFSVYDTEGERYEMMSIVDYGTTYHVVGRIPGHSQTELEESFCQLWARTFGPPGTIAVDLEGGLQAGLGRFTEWYGTRLRSAAGQAHFQGGVVERHGRIWKEIWQHVVDEHSVVEGDVEMCGTAVNAAKNELRKQCGYSPNQAVFGREPNVPRDLLDANAEQHSHVMTRDQQRGKEQALRLAARGAYFRVQGDAKLRRALLQRPRVAGPDLLVGDYVYFYRKPGNSKDWRWIGPGTIIGHEAKNAWVSFSGRCHLVAPEHLRRATGEEIGDTFTLQATKDDLQRLVAGDFGDPEAYDMNTEGEEVNIPGETETPEAGDAPPPRGARVDGGGERRWSSSWTCG